MIKHHGIGEPEIYLRFPLVKRIHPTINWKEGTAFWNNHETTFQETPLSSDNNLLLAYLKEEDKDIYINAKTLVSQQLAWQYDQRDKEDKSLEELIPGEYHEYLDVFDK